MKKLLTIFICLCLFPGIRQAVAQTTPSSVHLKGQLIDMGTTSVPCLYDGAAALLGDSRNLFIETDKDGFFDITIPLSEPTYYRLSRNTLYLTPGDDMTVKITQNNREATFEGVGAEANLYMRFRLFPHGGSFLEAGDNMREDFKSTRELIESLAAKRQQELNSLKNVSNEFKRLEGARIKADILNSYLSYEGYYSSVYKVNREEMKKRFQNFNQELEPIAHSILKELNDDAFLNVAVARDVLSYFFNPPYADWAKDITFTPRTKELYGATKYVQRLRRQLTPEELNEVNSYVSTMKNEDFRQELTQKVEEASRLMPGKPAFDIEMTDKEGNAHKLSELKGKVLYVDLWATWCGPCCAESPFFEKLSKEFAGKEILFVPISTDQHRKVWLGYLDAHTKELTQYNTVDTGLSTQWKVYGIPRFLLIDKDFNIINAYAPRPSEEGTKALLESLLK